MKKSFGFTLIEILVVVGIIGLLGALMIPNIQKTRQQNNYRQMHNEFLNLVAGLEEYKILCGVYPANVFWSPPSTGDIDCALTNIPAQRLSSLAKLTHLNGNLRYTSYASSSDPAKCSAYHFGFFITSGLPNDLQAKDSDFNGSNLSSDYVICQGSTTSIFNGADPTVFDLISNPNL